MSYRRIIQAIVLQRRIIQADVPIIRLNVPLRRIIQADVL